MLTAVAAFIVIGALLYTVLIRPVDLPAPEPVNPFHHLDDAKARVYENLRDLQFEYRLGKLSDEDYARTKKDLQLELARILSETDQLKQELGVSIQMKSPAAKKNPNVCPNCGAKFKEKLKFCGQCGKTMEA